MRARGFSSCVISSESRSACPLGWLPSSAVAPAGPVTVISFSPSFVWFRRSAVLEAVSFSNVTVAFLVLPSVVMLMLAILPLQSGKTHGQQMSTLSHREGHDDDRDAYQKLKKSLISLSSVFGAMFVTVTVFPEEVMVADGDAGYLLGVGVVRAMNDRRCK